MSLGDQSRALTAAFLATLLWWFPGHLVTAQDFSPNLVLVTMDGVRWQEVFGGVDSNLIEDDRYSREPEQLRRIYWREQRTERRKLLFPFIWSVIATDGALIGDRTQKSYMEVSNPWWFSYPGYNEILTGRADRDIDSNDKIYNPNVTILEVLNGLEGFNNRVMAFGSWDVFPYIINAQRSGVPVNAGFTTAPRAATDEARWLNAVSIEAPRLWSSVRVDFIPNGYAMDALKSPSPRAIYIAYGETDDCAHDRSYDRYIDAAHRTDLMLSKLWSWLQASPFYRDRTTLIISTDHGRGNTPDSWPHHYSKEAAAMAGMKDADSAPGSDQVWLAAIGPHIQSIGIVAGRWKQSQIAATALISLELQPETLMPWADQAIGELLR